MRANGASSLPWDTCTAMGAAPHCRPALEGKKHADRAKYNIPLPGDEAVESTVRMRLICTVFQSDIVVLLAHCIAKSCLKPFKSCELQQQSRRIFQLCAAQEMCAKTLQTPLKFHR